MRPYLLTLGFLALVLPSHVQAQQRENFLANIDQVRVGFRSYHADQGAGQFKVGMWTPVYIDVSAGPKGVPVTDPASPPYLEIETTDSEGIGTYYRLPVSLEPNETRTFIGYTKPGNTDTALNVSVKLHWEEKTFRAPRQVGGPLADFGSNLYLSLGSKIPDLHDALLSMAVQPNAAPQEFNNRDTAPRYAAYEADAQHLPDHWFGYESVDLMILNTDRKEFLTDLLRDANRPRLQAVAQWVRRGGRLIIPVDYQHQDLLAPVLQSPVWQPFVPVIPPANPGDVLKTAVRRLDDIERWANFPKPFPGPGAKPVTIAKLEPTPIAPGIWDVQAKTDDGRPLLARMPYGRGSITYIAFSLEQPPFTRWDGRVDFLKRMINQFAPPVNDKKIDAAAGWGVRGSIQSDITTLLHQQLDNFDVNIVPFGYVALFIILYILVIGPLDYFLLKHVFHKMELTWITFPTVVIGVSVVAYFSAYALKGNDLKINKVDIVDFDLRTELDGKQNTARAFVYGQTYCTILSPRMQNYTVGLEPNPAFWGAKANNPLSVDQISWMGRPESMGRAGSQGFFRRPYAYAEDARGIVNVPIPVWTTKAFTASWEATLSKVPFQADLIYLPHDAEGRKVTGTVKNNLDVDLEDAWIIFDERCYPLVGGLPGSSKGGGASKIALGLVNQDFGSWKKSSEEANLAERKQDFRALQGNYNPTSLICQAMFFQKFDQSNVLGNHGMRFLDFTWRLEKDFGQADNKLREAILYARVPFQRGPAEALTKGASPLPTNLWLGELPQNGKPRPTLAGTMAQDTYIRVLLPVRLSPNN